MFLVEGILRYCCFLCRFEKFVLQFATCDEKVSRGPVLTTKRGVDASMIESLFEEELELIVMCAFKLHESVRASPATQNVHIQPNLDRRPNFSLLVVYFENLALLKLIAWYLKLEESHWGRACPAYHEVHW